MRHYNHYIYIGTHLWHCIIKCDMLTHGPRGLEMARHEFGNKQWLGKYVLHPKADNINARLPRLWYEFDLELDLKFTKASVST